MNLYHRNGWPQLEIIKVQPTKEQIQLFAGLPDSVKLLDVKMFDESPVMATLDPFIMGPNIARVEPVRFIGFKITSPFSQVVPTGACLAFTEIEEFKARILSLRLHPPPGWSEGAMRTEDPQQ